MYTVEFTHSPVVDSALFMPELILIAKNVPEDILQYYLYDTVVDFCETTGIIVRELETDLYECESEYKLDIPECERIIKFNKICIGHKTLDLNKLREANCGFDKVCGSYGIRFVPPDTLVVSPTITHNKEACKLQVSITTAPHRDSCSIPEVLYERYRPVIVAGTLARALLIPDVENYNLAKYYQDKYNMGVAIANRHRLLAYSPSYVKIKRTKIL